MNIRHTLHIILAGLLLAACADTTEVERYLDAAEVHMEENPQMALETLESIDREMLATRKTFMISHPKLMSYLQKKNLTEWEIGCCLYCIGFNGAEPY